MNGKEYLKRYLNKQGELRVRNTPKSELKMGRHLNSLARFPSTEFDYEIDFEEIKLDDNEEEVECDEEEVECDEEEVTKEDKELVRKQRKLRELTKKYERLSNYESKGGKEMAEELVVEIKELAGEIFVDAMKDAVKYNHVKEFLKRGI